jgi:hypothetical protein
MGVLHEPDTVVNSKRAMEKGLFGEDQKYLEDKTDTLHSPEFDVILELNEESSSIASNVAIRVKSPLLQPKFIKRDKVWDSARHSRDGFP